MSSTINLSCFLMCCVSDLSRAFFLFSSFPFSFECVLRLNFNFDGFRAKKDFLLPSTTARCPPTTKQAAGTWNLAHQIPLFTSLHFQDFTSLHTKEPHIVSIKATDQPTIHLLVFKIYITQHSKQCHQYQRSAPESFSQPCSLHNLQVHLLPFAFVQQAPQ